MGEYEKDLLNMSPLPVVVPYFNHTNAGVNRRNLEQCLLHLSITPECRVVLVEGIWNREAELPDFSQRIFRHLKLDLQSPIWVKENLINLGIASLGEDWECAAWIDKDIQFLKPDWTRETMIQMESNDIVQPWSRVLYLNSSHEVDDDACKLPRFRHLVDHGRVDQRGWYSFSHSGDCLGQQGHAWAIRRTFYKKIGKLYDACISGSGDRALTMAIRHALGKAEETVRGIPFPGYQSATFLKYSNLFYGLKIGHLQGTIVHHWHGELSKRSYGERHELVAKHGFDPETHLSYSQNGTLRLSNPAVEQALLGYFYSREEHLIP